MCILYVLTSGLMFMTSGCYSQVYHETGLVVPHEVVYTSHVDPCWQGYGHYVYHDQVKVVYPKRYKSRVKYHGKVYPSHKHHVKRHHKKRHYKKHHLKKRHHKKRHLKKRYYKKRHLKKHNHKKRHYKKHKRHGKSKH